MCCLPGLSETCEGNGILLSVSLGMCDAGVDNGKCVLNKTPLDEVQRSRLLNLTPGQITTLLRKAPMFEWSSPWV